MNTDNIKVETEQCTIPSVIGSLSIDEIEKLAHKNFTYGSEMPIGSGARSLYENRKESFYCRV